MTDAVRSVRVPASSANLGAGFDVLGLALTLHAEVGLGEPPTGAHRAEPTHPAAVAFTRAGGTGDLWVRSPIPMGRGMGFSGAVRVGGCAVAAVQRDGAEALDDPTVLADVCAIATALEGHADNVAPSVYGGIVVCAGDHVQPVPLAVDPAIVVWVPDGVTTSTDRSRASLPPEVTRTDAVFNLGRVATFVAACASGDVAALRLATEDRLHQPTRLAEVPETAAALDAALDLGAWAAWLSGSGPTMAAMCDPADAARIASGLPATGHTKLLAIDRGGVTCDS
ncbi:MAG: homoserine kinase [Ilumatobacter sp.]|nr:homoserine kinase [Ilumatobacter sp.]